MENGKWKMENYNSPAMCIEEDEIDLRELFLKIWKYKIFISVFVFCVTFMSVVYVLSKPNQYKVFTILAPQEQQKSVNLGGLGVLASAAGINIGGGSGITPDVAFQNLINDYMFMKNFIKEKGYEKRLLSGTLQKDYIFAFNSDLFYKLFNSGDSNGGKEKNIDFFTGIYKPFVKGFSITADKKTGLITVSYIHPSRKFAYEVLNSFLAYATKYLINKNLQDINSQIDRYQKELAKTDNIELKTELAKLISSLIKQKVYINTSKYYKVKVVTDPYIPDIKDKTGPKRALIVIVAFITAFILAVFLVLFIEFIRTEKEQNE